MNEHTKKALSKNNLEYFKALEDRNELHSIDSAGRNLLFLSIMKEKHELSKILISKALDFRQKTKNGRTLVYIAAQYDRPEIIEELIAKNLNIDAADEEKVTPLMMAIQCNSNKAVEALLKAGAKVNLKDSRGESEICHCGLYDNVTALNLLLEHSADINFNSQNVFFRLVWARARNALEKYINLKPNLSFTDLRKISVMFSKSNEAEDDRFFSDTFSLLLKQGYSLNAFDESDRNIASYAAERRLFGTLLLLSSNGIDMKRRDLLNRTPKDYAAKNGASAEVLSQL